MISRIRWDFISAVCIPLGLVILRRLMCTNVLRAIGFDLYQLQMDRQTDNIGHITYAKDNVTRNCNVCVFAYISVRYTYSLPWKYGPHQIEATIMNDRPGFDSCTCIYKTSCR